jgi:hypothetical protein
VYSLSSGAGIAPTLASVRTRFLSEAARPGLDVLTGDPWQVAQDWAGMLATVLTAISRLTLLTLRRLYTVAVPTAAGEEVSWLPLAFADESGMLHRWLACDAIDDDVLAREGHSWHVIGDMVMCDAPMMLHVVEIGQQRNGRRHSPWARCYKHPAIANLFRFQRPDGKGGWRKLAGEQWKPFWYADQAKPDPAQWCDLMDSDHVTPALLHHISIQQPSRQAAQRILREIQQVSAGMQEAVRTHPTAAGGMEVAMARGACDPVGGPCPWQMACYREQPEHGIDALGLYQLRSEHAFERSGPQPQPPSNRRDYDTVVAS